MSIPFSNTHYRIPQGFANLLEGLTRDVLRDQPNDIPLFAAKYFAKLLKEREESGFDPAEWGAALEDRFYNDHSFQLAEDRTSTTQPEDESDGAVILEGSADPDAPRLAEEDQNVLAPVPDAPAYPPLAEVDQKSDEQYTLLHDQAAVVIQAAIRGHLVRREVKNLREEKAGDKSDLRQPSDESSEQVSDIQNFEQEGNDLDFTEQLESHHVSAERSQHRSGLEEPHEDTDIKEEKVVPSDTDLQEQQASVATETFLMETGENKEETLENMVVAEGEVVHDSDKDDERPPEAPEHKAVERSASREEMFTGLEPQQQTHNEDLVEEQKEFEALTTSMGQHPEQSNIEDGNNHKTETTGHPAIEGFSDQLAETMEQPATENTSDHVTEEDTSDHTTEPPVTEGGSNHTIEQHDKENTSDHTTEEPVTKDISAHTIEHPIAEATSDHTAKTTVDQQASHLIPDNEDPGEELP